MGRAYTWRGGGLISGESLYVRGAYKWGELIRGEWGS